ncbi:MAG: hypothetical protein CMI18_09215 [Opitutaceae bacterium]|nr:hypothetical protein [Opitutaceae bacterium]|tara:strand:+ start:7563 stop:8549 length:987 start_codon:yes stop_codon:yes gene_type:complete
MEFRRLGNSDIEISEMGLGCWTMGGLNTDQGKSVGWADVDEDEVVKAVKTAIDYGVNHFDNADVYGNGRAERMLARILKRIGIRSDEMIIASKMGHDAGEYAHAYEPAHIRNKCEQSLRNLDRDHIDIYYLHHGNFGRNNQYIQGAADTLDDLVKEGKIRLKGQSAYTAAHFKTSVPVIKPTVLQSWANAMDSQFIEPNGPVGQLMAENKLFFIAFNPLRQATLLDKYDPDNPPQFEEGDHRRDADKFTHENLLALQPKLKKIKDRFGNSIPELASMALRFVLSFPNVAGVIPGFRNEEQVLANLSAVNRKLTRGDIAFIKRVLMAPE